MAEETTLTVEEIVVSSLTPAEESTFNCSNSDPCDPAHTCCNCDPSDPCF